MTNIQICNAAMAALGHDQEITSLDTAVDTSAEAVKCAAFYDLARETTLRARPWSFAMREEPAYGEQELTTGAWLYSYDRPGECLRIVDVVDTIGKHVKFELREEVLLTARAVSTLTYVANVTDTTAFDALFTQALTYKLASMLAAPLTGKPALARQVQEMYTLALAEAGQVDATEDRNRGDDGEHNKYVTARA
jgi:hypothetical protein